MVDLMAIVLFVIALILGVWGVRGADISGEEAKIKISDIANSSHPPEGRGFPAASSFLRRHSPLAAVFVFGDFSFFRKGKTLRFHPRCCNAPITIQSMHSSHYFLLRQKWQATDIQPQYS
jgi:hypothetical protein